MKKPRNQIYNKNIVDYKFGLLTVKAPTAERNRDYVIWMCKCECDNKSGFRGTKHLF